MDNQIPPQVWGLIILIGLILIVMVASIVRSNRNEQKQEKSEAEDDGTLLQEATEKLINVRIPLLRKAMLGMRSEQIINTLFQIRGLYGVVSEESKLDLSYIFKHLAGSSDLTIYDIGRILIMITWEDYDVYPLVRTFLGIVDRQWEESFREPLDRYVQLQMGLRDNLKTDSDKYWIRAMNVEFALSILDSHPKF